MVDYGIKVSKAGFSILTAALKDQIFNSEANSLKIWMTGSVNVNVSETKTGVQGVGTADVSHNLTYAPFFFCYFKLKHASKLWFQDSLDDSMVFGNYIYGYAWTTPEKLYIRVLSSGNPLAAFTAVCYYIILIDKAYE